MMYRVFMVATVFLVVNNFGFAQTVTHSITPRIDTCTLDQIVVTASRREQISQWVSDDHSVINISKLQLSTSQNISEILSGVMAARFSDYGGGATKNISLRGAGSERTLVLVDGKRMGTNEGDLADLSLNVIEKIEIIEGGQSAIYGMDAIGGVVNIVTKQPHSGQISGYISASMASYEKTILKNSAYGPINGNSVGFSLGQRLGGWGWLTSGGFESSNGKFSFFDTNRISQVRDHNGFSDWNLLQKFTFEKNDLALDISGTYCDRAIENPGTLLFPVAANTKKQLASFSVDGSCKLIDNLKLRINSSIAFDNLHYTDPNPIMPQDSRHKHLGKNIEFVQEYTLNRQMFNTGIQLSLDSSSSNEIGNHSANQYSAFANCIFSQPFRILSFQETPAIRFDHVNTFGNSMNGKLGVISSCNFFFPKPSIFFNIGNSFKSPSFNDLYWPQDAYSVGNPHLKPEHSADWDIGVQLKNDNKGVSITGRVSYFSLELKDMIMWVPDENFIWSPKNVANAKIIGDKFEATIDLSEQWHVSGNVEYSEARDENTHFFLIYRPQLSIASSIQRTVESYNFGISYTYSSKVFTNDSNTTSLPGSDIFNFNFGYKMPFKIGSRENIWLVYDILNATDQNRSTNEGYPLPGREHRISLKMKI